jgi:antitoxin (DNA-binding transcriptional repressor) of toxin-antitoxin stability system
MIFKFEMKETMGKIITATEAVRKFSDLLNTIKFKGARYTIVRGGKPVATLGPAKMHSQESILGELKEILAKLPHLSDEAMAFEKDLKRVAKEQPKLPKGRAWV